MTVASVDYARKSKFIQVKPAVDRLVAGTALFFLLPLIAVIGWLVKRDGGPVFYGHTRIGKDGREFKCLKFRSMAVNGDEILADLLAHDPEAEAEWAATRKLRNDPRVTPVGRFLRKSSLDELPQLFNVLRGEMSVVGPRPVTRDELRHYGMRARDYMSCTPGITGLWQVSGRSDTTYRRRVALDTLYARQRSLLMDVQILFRTIPAVLNGSGAR